MPACLITLPKQTHRHLLWACSHFVVTKTIQIIRKKRLRPFAERQSPQSSVQMRAGAQDSAVHGREIINASINKDGVNTNGRQQGRRRSAFIAPSTVKWNLGVWKFIQVDFTWIFTAVGWLMGSDLLQRRLPGNSLAALTWRKESI